MRKKILNFREKLVKLLYFKYGRRKGGRGEENQEKNKEKVEEEDQEEFTQNCLLSRLLILSLSLLNVILDLGF